MTGFRPPIVAGVSGGVGTTTLALALHGTDAGTTTAEADVLVCRSNAESLDRATRIAHLAEPGRYPVLVVSLTGSERRPPSRVTELEECWAAVITAPHVNRWSAIVDPYREAAGLLGSPRDQLPRALRGYLDAVTRTALMVADSGRLGAPAPRIEVPRAEPVHRPFVPIAPTAVSTHPHTSTAPTGWSDHRIRANHDPAEAAYRPYVQPTNPPSILFPPAHHTPDDGPRPDGIPARGDMHGPGSDSAFGPSDGPIPLRPGPGDPLDRPASPTDVLRGQAPPDRIAGTRLAEVVRFDPDLTTVDSTGCGSLRLPELRPVRGIRVLAVDGVPG